MPKVKKTPRKYKQMMNEILQPPVVKPRPPPPPPLSPCVFPKLEKV